MLFFTTVVRKLNPPTVASTWKILSATSKNFSSTTGYTPEEIDRFTKAFRTVPSYEESIAAKDLTPFLQSIKFFKPMATYRKYVEYGDKIFGGRFKLTQIVKYLQSAHDPLQVMKEYLKNFDRNNEGYVSKEDFEYCMETLRMHDPRIRHICYETFLKEAHTNKDGRISIAECEEWLTKNLVPAQ